MKYNLTNIARRANALSRTMNKSLAWRKAWAEAKFARLDKEMDSNRNSAPAIWMPIREARFAQGGKQSVRLYAVRLLAGALPRTPSIPRRRAGELRRGRPCCATCGPVCELFAFGQVM